VAALLSAYAIWQPLRSDRETDRAIDFAADGKFPQAIAAVDRAHDHDPLTPRTYIVRSSIEDAAGHPDAARRALEQAVLDFPGDPQVWIQLAQYHLNSLNQPADALAIIRAALWLDPRSRAAQTVFLQANAALNPPAAAPVPTPPPSAPEPTPPPSTPKPPTAKPKPTPKPKATPEPEPEPKADQPKPKSTKPPPKADVPKTLGSDPPSD
jgi:tetratricopeptide (TPR) repeat protein